MGKCRVRQDHFNYEGISSVFGAVDIKAYLDYIKQKEPQDRTKFERQIFEIYQKAEKQGEKFCLDAVGKKIKAEYQNNKIIVLAAGALIVILAFRLFSKS